MRKPNPGTLAKAQRERPRISLIPPVDCLCAHAFEGADHRIRGLPIRGFLLACIAANTPESAVYEEATRRFPGIANIGLLRAEATPSRFAKRCLEITELADVSLGPCHLEANYMHELYYIYNQEEE